MREGDEEFTYVARTLKEAGYLNKGTLYQDHVIAALLEYEQWNEAKEKRELLDNLLETVFAIINPEAFKKWDEGKKVLEEEQEGVDEVVWEGESEEAYDLLGIDMEEITKALRGE